MKNNKDLRKRERNSVIKIFLIIFLVISLINFSYAFSTATFILNKFLLNIFVSFGGLFFGSYLIETHMQKKYVKSIKKQLHKNYLNYKTTSEKSNDIFIKEKCNEIINCIELLEISEKSSKMKNEIYACEEYVNKVIDEIKKYERNKNVEICKKSEIKIKLNSEEENNKINDVNIESETKCRKRERY